MGIFSIFKQFLVSNSIFHKITFLTFLSLCFLFFSQSLFAVVEQKSTALVELCSVNDPVPSKDGIRRLAMIVGVGEYKDPRINDLPGPPNDAQNMYDLLTGKGGYAFPKENVCLLVNAEATTKKFTQSFTSTLINRAQPGDEVVFFYAGHGSQVPDKLDDEADGMDEVFVLHDAQVDDLDSFFADDEFGDLLTKLYKKTQRITLFIDSCHSGSVMRGDVEYLARNIRYVPPPEFEEKMARMTVTDSTASQNQTSWITGSFPEMVVFTAAADGTLALERNARGIFTDAILNVLSKAHDSQLTYAQAARQIRPLVRAESHQVPYFQGNLQRSVFAGVNRDRPIGWEIIAVEPQLKLGGFPLPGVGKGAEFRVYDGSVTGAETQDPAKAKALIILEQSTGLNGIGKVVSQVADAKPIQPGDLALLARPGDAQRNLKVTLRAEDKTGGISVDRAAEIKAHLKQHADASKVIEVVADKGDFELSLDDDNRYVISGPENIARNRLTQEIDVINNLWQFSLQQVFNKINGEGGDQFVDQETLKVEIVPDKNQPDCVMNAQINSDQLTTNDIPLDCRWKIKVSLSKESPVPLQIGGLILSTDGGIYGLPQDNSTIMIKPGGNPVVLPGTFLAAEPLNIEDMVHIFGTHETNPVPWVQLTQKSATRSAGITTGLYRIMDQYLDGTRGVQTVQIEPDENKNLAWTKTSITMRVIENKNETKEP